MGHNIFIFNLITMKMFRPGIAVCSISIMLNHTNLVHNKMCTVCITLPRLKVSSFCLYFIAMVKYLISGALAAKYSSTWPFGACLWGSRAKSVHWLSHRSQRSTTGPWRKPPWIRVSARLSKSAFYRVRSLSYLHFAMTLELFDFS